MAYTTDNKEVLGDVYKNKTGVLPAGEYREADPGYRSGYRGTERIVDSADGKKVYMNNDHFETFTEIK